MLDAAKPKVADQGVWFDKRDKDGIMAHATYSTLDATANTNQLAVSNYFLRKPLPGGDIALWPILPKQMGLSDTTAVWYEDNDIPITVTAGEALDDNETTFDLATGQAAAGFIKVGTILRDTTAGKSEQVFVTAVATDALTVVRGYGSTSGETHDDATTWEVVGNVNDEGSAFGTVSYANRTRRTNGTTILDDQFKLTRTDMRRHYYGQPSNWDFQNERVMRRFERVLERHAIFSRYVARASGGAASAASGSMYGIIDTIENRAGSNIDASVGAFDYEVFDDAILSLYQNGYDESTPLILVLPPTGKQYAAYIHESAMRAPYESFATRGMKATHLQSTLGHELPIVTSSAIPSDHFLILNTDLIRVWFVDDIMAYDLPLGEQGNDFQARRFLAEMTLEMHMADKAHYLGKGVTYTRPS